MTDQLDRLKAGLVDRYAIEQEIGCAEWGRSERAPGVKDVVMKAGARW